MSWLVEEEATQMELASRFRQLMVASDILMIPGAHDGMSAAIAKKVGFQALYLSGAAYTASRALPDLGIVNATEIADRAKDIIRASRLPLLVDIDTGFGGVLNVMRTAREMVEAKVAAVQIEDQALPKKCGHLNGKRLVPIEEMTEKIRAIKEAAPTLIVIARTDAKDVEGLEAMMERIRCYAEAGADAVFPEALENEEEFKHVGQGTRIPLLANMTEFGRTPYYTAQQFHSWGFQMVIFPVTSLRVAAKAYENIFSTILHNGTQAEALDQMQTRSELYEVIRYYDYEKMDNKIARTVLPLEGK